VSTIYALFLGLLQGLLEFLPVSSSAHFKLAKHFLDLKVLDNSPIFELVCNLGTSLAAIIFLRKEIYNILFHDRQKFFLILLAIVPLVPIYIFFKHIQKLTSSMEVLGFFFIVTSLLLFTAIFYKNKTIENSSNRKIKDMLFIGFMQGLALIPGISRSGSTISAACYRSWSIKEAISFSFLLSIPTVMGGNVLEAAKLFLKDAPTLNISLISYIVGFLASFIMGIVSIRFIFSITSKKKLLPFAWYTLILGLVTIVYFNFV